MRELGQFLYGTYERTVRHEFGRLAQRRRVSLGQLRFLGRVLTRHELRTALALTVLCLVSATLLLVRWYGRHTVVVPAVGGEYSEGVIGLPRTGNPLLTENEAERDLAYLTYRGLFRYDARTTVAPDLADSWSLGPDKKTYTVKLRPNLRWSDGVPLTANDVAFTFQSLLNDKLKSPRAGDFAGVAAAATDDTTVTFTLPQPYSPFLSALTLGVIPAHVWQKIPLAQWREAPASLQPVGTGPFQAHAVNRDRQGELRSVTLEPNKFSPTGQPFLTKLVLKFYPDTTSALAALHDGSVDGLGGISLTEALALNTLKFSHYELGLPQYTALFYNLSQPSPLSSKLVRQALALTVNRPQLSHQALGADAVPAMSPFPFGDARRRTSGRAAATYNPARAAELLTQAGYSRENDHAPWSSQGTPLAFTLTTANSAQHVAVATELARQWREAGITVTLDLKPDEELHANTIPQRSYQAILAREVIGFEPDPYPFWHSSQADNGGLNLANFKNHEADKLLEDARRTDDLETRLQYYAGFQDILNDESPATFLYSTGYVYVVSRAMRVPAPGTIAEPADRFRDLAQWYVSTQRTFRW